MPQRSLVQSFRHQPRGCGPHGCVPGGSRGPPGPVLVNTALRDALSPQPGERMLEVGCGSGALCRLVAPACCPAGSCWGWMSRRRWWRPRGRWPSRRRPAFRGRRRRGAAGLRTRRRRRLRRPAVVACGRSGPRRRRDGARGQTGRPGRADGLGFRDLTVTHPDRELTRRLLHWRCDHHSGDNWSGRRCWATRWRPGCAT